MGGRKEGKGGREERREGIGWERGRKEGRMGGRKEGKGE